jgi:hypothetical protein
LPEGVTGDRKFGMSLNILGDSAWNDGNCMKNDVRFTGASAKPENPPIGFEISDRPSVLPSIYIYQRGFHWWTLLEI